MNKGARIFVVCWNNVLVGFNSMLNMPSGTLKNAFREHRLVVLPDFQSLGFGTAISNAMGEYLVSKGCKYFSRSTHVRLGRHRTNSTQWTPTSTNQVLRSNLNESNKGTTQGAKYRILDDKRVAYSFEYVGQAYNTKKHQTIVCNGDIDISTANKMLDSVIDENKFPIIVAGIASIKEITVWEEIAKERGIRHEVLKIKRKGEFHLNKTAVGDGLFDAILIATSDREIVSDKKMQIGKCITCYDENKTQFYIFDKERGTKTKYET